MDRPQSVHVQVPEVVDQPHLPVLPLDQGHILPLHQSLTLLTLDKVQGRAPLGGLVNTDTPDDAPLQQLKHGLLDALVNPCRV